jgi:Holliday junction DNA helicase RuvA
MIITLRGKVIHKLADAVVLETGGVGYEVFLAPQALGRTKVGQAAGFWTYEYLREDAQEIYGFSERAELEMYRKLVAVSGVGPKMALQIMGLGSVSDIEAIIERGDVEMISRVHRVGRKTAQKIILELKGKLVQSEPVSRESGEVVLALINMGYDRKQAQEAVATVREKEETVEGQLKAALKELAR